ncbi:MAG TPA: nitrate- and nitrite sensing domain-containing protein [Actinomycetota bacterium]|nr:nitrate- and nitrite sensing domain-containing protein [Actinomycetota bacterium]
MFGNLSIRPKMVVLLAVPVAGTALLGATGVAGAWGDRARAAEERREAAAARQALVVVHELQEERVRAVSWAAGEGGQGELGARRRRVDSALAAYRAGAAGLGPTGDPALDQAVAGAAGRLDRLAVVRAEVDRRLVDPERASATHDALVSPLLGVARGLAANLDAPVPARTARLLLAVTTAKEATGQERTLLAGTLPAVSSASTRVWLAAAAAVARHELDAVRAAAGERLAGIDRALAAAGVRTVRDLELRLLQPVPDLGSPATWGPGGTGWPSGPRRCGGWSGRSPVTWTRPRWRRCGSGNGGSATGWCWRGWSSSPSWSRRRCSSGAWVAGGCGRGRRPGRPCPAWPAGARRWPTASSSCSRTWPGTSPTRNAARACSESTTSPPGCTAPPRPCWP